MGGSLESGEIPVGQGFLVWATDENPVLVAPEAARVGSWSPIRGLTGAPARPVEAPTLPHIRFHLDARVGTQARTAMAAVSIVEDAALGRDPFDAIALSGQRGGDALRLVAAAPGGDALAVAAVPGEAEVALHAEALTSGLPTDAEATLAWESVALADGWTATLYDRATGRSHDLSASGATRISLRASDALTVTKADLAPAAQEAPVGLSALREGGGLPEARPLQLAEGRTARFVVSVHPPAATSTEASGGALVLGLPVPNPAQALVRVPFSLDGVRDVRLAVYNTLGREVAVLARGPMGAGEHVAAWDTRALAPGVYMIRLTSGATSQTRRLTVVR